MANAFRSCLILLLILSFSLMSGAQKITAKFYDRNWTECEIAKASFYSNVEKTDSGWLRNDYYISTNGLKMTAHFKDSICKVKNGGAMYFFVNDKLESTGTYIDNKREGIYIRYHYNGMMADSASYRNDKPIANRFSWHTNGFMADSIFTKNDSTTVEVQWFDNGNLSEYGYYINNKKHGKWNYFHKNGTQAAIELNEHGKVISADFFNEDGSVQTDTSRINREAIFKNGIKDWSNYLSGKIYWPEQYKITNSNTATVVTLFIINEDGKIEGYYLDVPFHRLLDNIALDAIKNAPLWKPALEDGPG